MQFQTKIFQDLSVSQLYDILRLRSEIFVVEQNCVYLDLDNKDQKAIHILGYFDSKLVTYCRLFKPNDYFENASIGRVVVDSNYRKNKFGHLLMQKAIQEIESQFNSKTITISAQLYLKIFYESHGFIATSAVYLEDDIEHIEMKKVE